MVRGAYPSRRLNQAFVLMEKAVNVLEKGRRECASEFTSTFGFYADRLRGLIDAGDSVSWGMRKTYLRWRAREQLNKKNR
jgi:hypothetical protein